MTPRLTCVSVRPFERIIGGVIGVAGAGATAAATYRGWIAAGDSVSRIWVAKLEALSPAPSKSITWARNEVGSPTVSWRPVMSELTAWGSNTVVLASQWVRGVTAV